jgi:succinyl-CoA synthetase beta subunit
MVAEALDIARETYLAILLDRAYGGAVLMGSPMGGVDIEEVAENHPDQIFTVKEQKLSIFMIRVFFSQQLILKLA